ncbi:Ca(2+)-dependent cysteine protease [Pleurotus ostreatus]|nr:Ca(2+)-dependent cysteine protease [Pleurotus ostreatus]
MWNSGYDQNQYSSSNTEQFRPGYSPSYAPNPGRYSGPPGSGYQGARPVASLWGSEQGAPSGYYPPPPGPPPTSRATYPGEGYGYPNQNDDQPGYQHYPPPSHPPNRPPTDTQYYGPEFEDQQHNRSQPSFQYSQCNGRKKALSIGINYFGQDGELSGCINDVKNITRFLCTQFGYNEDDIVILTDDATNPRQLPTRDNIIHAMRWLVSDAQPNDSLFFHYSGHGGQTKDLDGDEEDGFDEVIYPVRIFLSLVDFQESGHIVDDEMHEIMVRPLPPGCRLTAIYDSCHSGTALDLPYIYSTEGKIKEPNLAAEVGQGLLGAVTSYARGDMGGVFQSAMGIFKSATSSTKAEKITKATRTSPADVISWSGCKDDQTSADTQEAGQATGAMSFAFVSALKENPQQSYQQLLNSVRTILRDNYSQKPQLSASHPMDTDLLFIC